MTGETRRAYGSGTLYISDGRWFGRWHTVDGKRPNRVLGVVAEMTREQAEEKLRLCVATRATYHRRAGQLRHNDEAGVYVITGGGMAKIGRTDRTPVAVRLERLQRCSPVPLELHRFLPLPFPSAVECALHAHFAAQRHYGEWFAGSVVHTIDRWSDGDILALVPTGRRAHRKKAAP